MSKLLMTCFHPLSPLCASLGLLVLRVGVGFSMFSLHGIDKWQRLFGPGPIAFPDPIGLGATTSLVLAVFAEVVCALLLIVGLATRLAAIPLLITMLVAILIVHAQDPIKEVESAILYAIATGTLLLTGPGSLSLDHLIHRRLLAREPRLPDTDARLRT